MLGSKSHWTWSLLIHAAAGLVLIALVRSVSPIVPVSSHSQSGAPSHPSARPPSRRVMINIEVPSPTRPALRAIHRAVRAAPSRLQAKLQDLPSAAIPGRDAQANAPFTSDAAFWQKIRDRFDQVLGRPESSRWLSGPARLVVGFRVDAEGHVGALRLAKASGFATLDAEVMERLGPLVSSASDPIKEPSLEATLAVEFQSEF